MSWNLPSLIPQPDPITSSSSVFTLHLLNFKLSFHFSPPLYCFLFCHPLCFCSSLPALFLSPGSLVILVASLCPPHSLVLFCNGVTHCISSLYITPLTGSLFMFAFSVWLAKTTINQTNNRSCCSWKTKKLKKKKQLNFSLICKIEMKIKSHFPGQRFCRFTDLQKGRVLAASSASDRLPERCEK